MTGKSFTPLRNTLVPILGLLGMLLLAGGCARPVVGGELPPHRDILVNSGEIAIRNEPHYGCAPRGG